MTPRTYAIKMRERGQVTIPQSVRNSFAVEDGDVLTLIQFDNFIFLTPTQLQTPALAEQFSRLMDEENVSLADLLQGLAEERQTSWKNREA